MEIGIVETNYVKHGFEHSLTKNKNEIEMG